MTMKNWKARSVDTKTAFLKGDLNEKIYMEKAEDFTDPEHPMWVYEILRSLYSLKKSPCQWNEKPHQFMLSSVSKQSS